MAVRKEAAERSRLEKEAGEEGERLKAQAKEEHARLRAQAEEERARATCLQQQLGQAQEAARRLEEELEAEKVRLLVEGFLQCPAELVSLHGALERWVCLG